MKYGGVFMSIGENIKKYRKEKGLTQRALADLIGVSVQAVSKWETDAGAPDISQVVPLASALEISTDALFAYEYHIKPEGYEMLRKEYSRQSVFRDQSYTFREYEILCNYFLAHPQNSDAASMCLKCLVDMIVAGNLQNKGKSELIADCEKYANCVFKYETDADTVFMNHFVLARGYAALGETEKSKEILHKIPVYFGDRLYWEAEIAQANKDYEEAMLKCRSSFAVKARYVSRCIRMAAELCEANSGRDETRSVIAYREYMLRVIDAFLSGGDYLPCRQIYQKGALLQGIVRRYVYLNDSENAIKYANILFDTKQAFESFLKNPNAYTSLLFENNDSEIYQQDTKKELEVFLERTMVYLKKLTDYETNSAIQHLIKKYNSI